MYLGFIAVFGYPSICYEKRVFVFKAEGRAFENKIFRFTWIRYTLDISLTYQINETPNENSNPKNLRSK